MDDKELLEKAGRAARYELTWADDRSMCWLKECYDDRQNTDDPWNPLRDDGDVFKLAVRLGIGTIHHKGWGQVMHPSLGERVDFSYGQDAKAATRRAIVLVAAVINDSQNVPTGLNNREQTK